MEIAQAFADYEQAATTAIRDAADESALEAARIEFLGKKRGRLKDLQRLIGSAPAEDRREIGRQFNAAKQTVESLLSQRQGELSQPRRAASGIDVTLPGRVSRLGTLHPITQTIEELKEIMGRFGFSSVEGPEIEDEHHNFAALNIPQEHPARDPLDNFYVATAARTAQIPTTGGDQDRQSEAPASGKRDGGPVLLRSQTSTVQIRVMEQGPPPVRIVSLGRVYRPDTQDDTHSCMFHQIEGLMVDRHVTLAHLKTILRIFAQAYLGEAVQVRFRPSFFPFTEPSVEVDMHWGDDWIELGGAGMVDPHVLRAVGYDPEQWSGFAFGMGVERFCMRRHNVRNIRLFLENDARFLRQFA